MGRFGPRRGKRAVYQEQWVGGVCFWCPGLKPGANHAANYYLALVDQVRVR